MEHGTDAVRPETSECEDFVESQGFVYDFATKSAGVSLEPCH